MLKRKGGGGGGQRPFEQCSKKLHFSLMMASLIQVLIIRNNPVRINNFQRQEALYEEGNFLRSAVWTLPRGDYVYSSVAKTIFSHFPLACRIYR